MSVAADFGSIIGFDFEDYLNSCLSFLKDDYPIIIGYNTGLIDSDSGSMSRLAVLEKKSEELDSIIMSNRLRISGIEFWDVMESVDTIKDTLSTVRNTKKWVRSNGEGVKHNSFVQEVVLRQGDGIEDITASRGMDSDDWSEIAIDNNLAEEDYTIDGGSVLKIRVPKTVFNITDVVDVMTPDRMFGRDIKAKLTFTDDDLESLSQDDTISQSMNTMISLKKRDIQEYPNLGATKDVGGNKNMLSIPSVFRGIAGVFMTDSIIEDVQMTDASISGDNISVVITIKTILNKEIIKAITL